MSMPYHDRHGHTIATWLLLLAHQPTIQSRLLADAEIFSMFFAALRTRVRWTEEIDTMLTNLSVRKSEVRFDIKAFEAWKKSDENPFSGKISSLYLEAIFEGVQLYTHVKRQPKAWEQALAALMDQLPPGTIQDPEDGNLNELEAHLKDPQAQLPTPGESLFHANMVVLDFLLRLDNRERNLMEFGFLLAHDESVRLFFDVLHRAGVSWRLILSTMFQIDEDTVEELTSSKGALMKSGLLSIDINTRRVFPLSPFWHEWLSASYVTMAAMFKPLVRPLIKRPNAGALGRLHPDDRAIVSDLLNRKHTLTSDSGVNVLLYGPRSIDKEGLVADLLTQNNLAMITLAPGIPEREMGAIAYVAQRYVAFTAPQAVLVLPSADQILTRTRRGMKSFAFFSVEMDDEVEDADTDAALLSFNPAKTLWLVNAPDRLSEDNLGRFLYVSEVKAASRAERLAEIESILEDLDVSPELHKELSQHLRLSEQQLKSAYRLVEQVAQPGPDVWLPEGVERNTREHREVLIRRMIDQSQRAMNRREREHLRQPVTTYSLDLLNLNSSFPVPKIIQSLKHRQQGTLCFYGLPGTGKTQLAEHIAVQLDRPIIMKRASELTNKYIGESEKNIRAMFDEATEEGAVLFLDEADTFLMDRARAQHSWETSSVNEMLQGMERFRGIFICATNLFDTLDRAALRRFTFKLQFNSLDEDQRWAMLCNEAKLDPSTMAPAEVEHIKNELLLMYELTPGDFATIQRKVELMGQPLTLAEWLKELESEANFKRNAENHQRRLLESVVRHA